jgi:3-hydroxyisobutyrate dehydrogenase
MRMAIGYVGLGSMGGALAERLLLSHPLQVHDRAPAASERLARRGAVAVPRLPAIAETCDLIFLCLPTSIQVRDAIFGPGGLAEGLRPGTMVVDQTTGDPNETRAMAAELAGRGVALIDAPVSGGIAGAQAGTIAIMVGASDEQYGRVQPVLQSISPNVFHAGGVGNGHVIKLVNNLMSCVQRLLSFEAMALAAKNGVDPKTATAVLVASGGRNAYLEKMMGPRILEGKLDVGFTLGLAHKDVRLACQLGIDSEVPMFFGNVARELYQSSIAEMGRESQVDTVGFLFDRLAGTEVVPRETDLSARAALEGAPACTGSSTRRASRYAARWLAPTSSSGR